MKDCERLVSVLHQVSDSMPHDEIVLRLILEDDLMLKLATQTIRYKIADYTEVEKHFARVKFLEKNPVTQFLNEAANDKDAAEAFEKFNERTDIDHLIKLNALYLLSERHEKKRLAFSLNL